MVQHLLGVRSGLDAEVAERSVQFLVAEEHDGVFVDFGAEEGRGPAGAEWLSGRSMQSMLVSSTKVAVVCRRALEICWGKTVYHHWWWFGCAL